MKTTFENIRIGDYVFSSWSRVHGKVIAKREETLTVRWNKDLSQEVNKHSRSWDGFVRRGEVTWALNGLQHIKRRHNL